MDARETSSVLKFVRSISTLLNTLLLRRRYNQVGRPLPVGFIATPDRIEGGFRVEVFETQHADRTAQAPRRLGRHAGRTVSWGDIEAAAEHLLGIAPAATAQFEDRRAGLEVIQEAAQPPEARILTAILTLLNRRVTDFKHSTGRNRSESFQIFM